MRVKKQQLELDMKGSPKMAKMEEWDGETTFSPIDSSKEHLNAELIPQNNCECWQRTSGTQKGSPLSSKGGRKKYKRQKKETKEVEMEFRPGKGVLKREKFPNTRKHSHCQVCG